MNMQHLVGIGKMVISEDADDVLVAPNLGSCLGFVIYDKKRRRGGMIHCLLPLSKGHAERATDEPTAFVDTGVVILLDKMLQGTSKDQLVLAAAGCSNINDTNNVFEIGKRNHTILKKILWKNELLLAAEDVGENYSRTLSLSNSNGEVWVKSNGTAKRLA